MRELAHIGFADDPIASHSAQFPLARPDNTVSHDRPSPVGVRPWNLRAMTAPPTADWPIGRYSYNHETQTVVDEMGRPLTMGDPTAYKRSNNDGDEGPSEDWKNDFCPDEPYGA